MGAGPTRTGRVVLSRVLEAYLPVCLYLLWVREYSEALCQIVFARYREVEKYFSLGLSCSFVS